MKRVVVYTFLSLIWFKHFTIIPKPIHVIPVPVRIISPVVSTEESSTSSDPASNDASGDPSSPGDGGDF